MNPIVMCLGKFDVLHTGHLHHLKEATKYSDYLIVVITADKYLPKPPVFNQEIRKETLELLPWVDEVYICEDKTGIPAIEKFKPKYLIKGPDYSNISEILEKEAVEDYGGTVVIISPKVVYSSTKLQNQSGPFLNLKTEIKQSLISDFIKCCSEISVGVIGEPIIDIFQNVILDGQSPKSYCPSFTKQGDEIIQMGGATYTARHLQNFCKNWKAFPDKDRYSVTKYRYLDCFSNKKHFEIKYGKKIRIDKDIFQLTLQNTIKENDLVLIADFGHGLFDNKELQDGLYLMVQTNSSNFGYNKVSKWNQYRSKLVCLDRTEASLILGKQINNCNKKLMKQLYQQLNTDVVILTMYKYGSIYFDQEEYYVEFPALALNIVDSIGAGDAFFTLASLAHYLGYKPKEVLFLASLASAANTQHLCTEKAANPFIMQQIGKAVL
jgi:cytidyltransferase-like protein